MTNRVTLVTPPDDVSFDAVRILLADLTTEHTNLISSLVTKSNSITPIVFYIWKPSQSIEWLLDKKHKSKIIIMNAESEHQSIVAYLSAFTKTHYFGNLKDLNLANNNIIQTVEDLEKIFTLME
jgi:hypothetical protein